MGNLFSSAPAPDAPSELSLQLRAALRTRDGPCRTNTTKEGEAPDQGTAEEQQQQQQLPLHRSVRALQLLSDATPADIQVEHLLELADKDWDETERHPDVLRVISQLVHLAAPEHVESLAVTCILYQKCWPALDAALSKLVLLRQREADAATAAAAAAASSSSSASKEKQKNQHHRSANDHERIFIVAAEAAPLSALMSVLQLGWLDRRHGADQFRVLIRRLAKLHTPPRSPEEVLRLEREKRKQQKDGKAGGGDRTNSFAFQQEIQMMNSEEAKQARAALAETQRRMPPSEAQQVLVRLLQMLDVPVASEVVDAALAVLREVCETSFASPATEQEEEQGGGGEGGGEENQTSTASKAAATSTAGGGAAAAAAPTATSNVARSLDSLIETLERYTRWSQIEATSPDPDEAPLSWQVSRPEMREHVTGVALALEKAGLTFAPAANVLAYAVAPNTELE